jgi:molecular chaperone HtpG
MKSKLAKNSFRSYCSKQTLYNLSDGQAAPFIITQLIYRMKEMSQSGGGGMFGMGNMLRCTT